MFVEDFPAFFDTATGFAQKAKLGGADVDVLFENEYVRSMVGTLGMATSQQAALVRTTQVGEAAEGQLLQIGDLQYTVAEHHPDGTGISVLLLEVAA